MAEILVETDLTKINDALKTIAEMKKQIALAKAAGIDMGMQEKVVLDQEQKLRSIKQVYFPGR